ncbi:hypothetical protein BpHYR1_034983 [Brachionus plicatilis]|uniref:Transmembrane protein n=1 Tax=Brachionus plicatilis TaxID=10195 RepID=A0A3M7R312_BRAPC|nr:hypothetical protein BpHYR1_034983 [Brachionus plicatilis]
MMNTVSTSSGTLLNMNNHDQHPKNSGQTRIVPMMLNKARTKFQAIRAFLKSYLSLVLILCHFWTVTFKNDSV